MTETLIESIRAAVAEDASPEARAAGAAACRSVLERIQPHVRPAETASTAAEPQLPVAAIAAALRGSSPDQILDLAIVKLRSLVPAEAQAAPARKFHIPLVPMRKP